VRVFLVIEYDIAWLRHLLRPEVLVHHLLIEAERHADHELTQFTHLVDRVLVELPAVEHLLAHGLDPPDVLVQLEVAHCLQVIFVVHGVELLVEAG